MVHQINFLRVYVILFTENALYPEKDHQQRKKLENIIPLTQEELELG